MSALSDLLQQANDKNPMTIRARAQRIGNALHYVTIGKFQRGDHAKNPADDTLRLLAAAYDLPFRELQRAAGVPVGAGPYEPPSEASRLTRAEQEAITHLIRTIAAAKGELDAGNIQEKNGQGDLHVAQPIEEQHTGPGPQTRKGRRRPDPKPAVRDLGPDSSKKL